MKKITALILLVSCFNAMALGGQLTCRYINGDSWTISTNSHSQLSNYYRLCKSDGGYGFIYTNPELEP